MNGSWSKISLLFLLVVALVYWLFTLAVVPAYTYSLLGMSFGSTVFWPSAMGVSLQMADCGTSSGSCMLDWAAGFQRKTPGCGCSSGWRSVLCF